MCGSNKRLTAADSREETSWAAVEFRGEILYNNRTFYLEKSEVTLDLPRISHHTIRSLQMMAVIIISGGSQREKGKETTAR